MQCQSAIGYWRLLSHQLLRFNHGINAQLSRNVSELPKREVSSCVFKRTTNFHTYGTHVNSIFQKFATSPSVAVVGCNCSCRNQRRNFSITSQKHKKEEITVNFLNRDGETMTVKGKVGESLLDTVIDNDVDIDGFGACEGTLACSTCHLVFDEEIFEMLPEKLDEEEDMLDLAYGLEDTSRLGCQIYLTKEMDNMVVSVPEGINDARDA